MSLDFFRIDKGFQLDDTSTYLTGTGVPGTTADTNGVVVGSVYTDTVDGSIYTKIAAGSGTDKWQKMASEQYVNNAVGATVSWREPAQVRDTTSTAVPTGTAGAPVTVAGQSIADGGRVLFSAVTGGAGPNVYVYDQTTGTFVEDVNPESNGDAVYVQAGADAGKTFIYNGTAWVQSDQASLDEEGFLRAYAGKPSVGNVMPDYTSTNIVADGQSLLDAISALDAAAGADVALGNWITPVNTVNQNITSLDTVIGPNFGATNHLVSLATTGTVAGNLAILDGKFGPGLIAGSYVTLGQAAFPAIQALDIAIGANVSTANYVLSTNTIQGNIQTLDTAIGPNVVDGGYILAADAVQENIQALDAALTEATKETNVVNVTSATLIDSLPVASTSVAKFFVYVEEAATPANRYATEVYVLSDGVSSVDYTKYATLRVGASIVGLQVSAQVSGANFGIQVSSTAAVNVTVRRASVI